VEGRERKVENKKIAEEFGNITLIHYLCKRYRSMGRLLDEKESIQYMLRCETGKIKPKNVVRGSQEWEPLFALPLRKK